jgi:thioredoxin 1
MTPILEELKKEYVGQMQVEFIDVNENRDAARSFGIRVIPTQVFLDSAGKELWRHEGFMPKEDILAKWKELGVRFVEGPGTH